NGNDDDGEHVGFHHGAEEVVGEDAHDDVHDAGRLGCLIGELAQLGAGEGLEEPLKEVDDHQADDHGHGGGEHVVDKGLDAHAAHALQVLQGDDAGGDGADHHRHHQEFQEVDVNGADGLDPLGGEVRRL